MTQTRLLLLSAICLVLPACASSEPPILPPPEPIISGDVFSTAQGDMIVQPLNHATFVMSWGPRLIYVDPVGGAARFEGLPAPNVILVTDIHGDHMNADTLTAIARHDMAIIA